MNYLGLMAPGSDVIVEVFLCDKNKFYLSTNIPAWTAWTMLRKRGFSSLRLSIRPICRVKVEASQSRTSEGTDSDWMSLSSSSVSTKRLEETTSLLLLVVIVVVVQDRNKGTKKEDAETKDLLKYLLFIAHLHSQRIELKS